MRVVPWLSCQRRRCRVSVRPTGNVSAGRQFLMPGQISSAVDVQEKILEILRQEGAVPVYKLAKSLGLTYGGAQ